MASPVDICNLALGHLGDVANVVSIDPPEASAQAEHCARFYPMARDALLEMHEWGFATRRVLLEQMTPEFPAWRYCYRMPSDALNLLAVLDNKAQDDSSVPVVSGYAWPMGNTVQRGVYTPQEFVAETLDDGTEVILTNQADAMLRYVRRITDTSKFSPLFVQALAASLASMLAGPVIKGEAGMQAAARWQVIAFGQDGRSGLFGKAAASDAGQRRSTARDRQNVPWLGVR